MGYLDEYITDNDKQFDYTHGTDIKPYKHGTLADIGLGTISGAAKGVLSVSNAASRLIEGDEVADQRMSQVNDAFTPKNQGNAGHIASSIAEPLAVGLTGAPLGTFGVAGAVGLGTRASEHTRLTQNMGVDQDTADTVSNLSGVGMGALVLVPMSNVFKGALLDYAVTVGGTTAAGQTLSYVEGDYLQGKGYKKQGQMYKDMATDPTAITTSLVIGSAFFALGRLQKDPRATPEQIKQAEDATDRAVDQAIAEADLNSIPNKPTSVSDTLQHQENLNTAIDQVISGERVSIPKAISNENLQSKNTTNKKTNQTINNTINLKSNVSSKQPQLIQDSYTLAQQVGFSPSQAKWLIGELGRENDFNLDMMFGFHTDAANSKRNGGIISWQGNRATNLFNRMQDKGLVNSDGTFKRTNESLKEQLAFLHDEIQSNSQWKASFLDKKNITNEEARSALGGKGSIIGWARGQSKLSNGKAFDWQSHEARANKYSDMVDSDLNIVRNVDESTANLIASKSYSDLDSTITRTDLNSPSQVKLDPVDIEAFDMSHQLRYTEEDSDFPTISRFEDDPLTPEVMHEINKIIDQASKEAEITPIPHTAEGVRVKHDKAIAKEFKPEESKLSVWQERQRYEDGKYHQELTRTTDKEGHQVQELQYRGSYVRRTIDDAGKTISIHVGRANKSDFVNHKNNKELETALNRIFDTNNYGYLSQIPKGLDTIAKLEAQPDLVISSKRTGEDLTAVQWKSKLQREQDNIQTLSKAMLTLAKCALKQAI